MADQKAYYMTSKELAAKVGASTTWVMSQLSKGKIPYIETKRGRFIASNELDTARALYEQGSSAAKQARIQNVARGREALAKMHAERNTKTLKTLTKLLEAQTRMMLLMEQILDALTAPGPRKEIASCMTDDAENAAAQHPSLGH